MKRTQFIIMGFLAITVFSSFQNCSKVQYESAASSSGDGTQGTKGNVVTPSPTPTPTPTPTPPPPGGTVTTIRTFSPAVAVRDVSCLACHANIQANLITDFGFGNPWYMGALQNGNDFGNLHYMATGWQTMAGVAGQVIVPQATVPTSFVQAEMQSGATAPTNPSLLTYLTLPTIKNYGGGWYSYFGEPTPSSFSLTNSVSPGAGNAPVVEQSNVYIGAPTKSQILAIAPNVSPASPFIQVVGQTAGGLSGLSIVTGMNGQSYITNSGPVNCSNSDVVINGTLLLNSLQVYAENGGCRLYVTGSVFIQGPITYLNSSQTADPTTNLQVTSATSIIMGVGLNGHALNGDGSIDGTSSTPLQVRMLTDVRSNLLMRVATTASAYTSYANGVVAEGNNIGLPLLQDASVPGSLPTAASAAKQQRAAINFQHILLNAPLIHSRYMGNVVGVVVAESAMFSLGEFAFSYDPVFAKVAVLPALPYDILCTTAPCRPANP